MAIELQKGLVLHMPLAPEYYNAGTKRMSDICAKRNHGTSANALVTVADRMGQLRAMSFNGTSDYVDCGNDASLDITDEITISGWVKLNTNVLGWYSALALKPGCFEFRIRGTNNPTPNQLNSVIYRTDVTLSESRGSYLSLDTWYHIAVVASKSNNIVEMYLDGELDASTTNNANKDICVSGHNLRLGLGSTFLPGSIDEVRIYNRALNTDEITFLSEAYNPKLSIGTLYKDLVLDMPLHTPYIKDATPGSEVMSDKSAYRNTGQNSGGDIAADHTTFVSANSDYVRITDDNSLDNSPYLSVLCWIKGAGQNTKGIFCKYDYNNKRSWLVYSHNASPYQKMRLVVSDDGTVSTGHAKIYTSSLDILDSTWHLVGFSFDAGTLKLFIDGVEDTNPTKTQDDAITTIFPTDIDVMIGSYLSNNVPVGFFNGDIAKARIYNRVLTAAEWKLYYDQTKGLYL